MIHLQTNIIHAMNAIDDGIMDGMVEYGEHMYLLDTSNRELGVIISTKFLRSTGAGIATYHTSFGSHHTVQQIIANPLARSENPPLLDILPGWSPNTVPDPLIIPSSY
jgi:hypothetical protein